MKDGQLLRVKVIKDEDDLPKSERAMYFVGIKDNLNPDVYEWFIYENPIMSNNQAEYWLNTFDWYLEPVEEQESITFKEPEFDEATVKKLDMVRELANKKAGKRGIGEKESKPKDCFSCALLFDNRHHLNVPLCPGCFKYSMWTAGIKYCKRLDAGRDFLMTQDPKYLTAEDCLEAFGFTMDGLNEID